VEEVSSGGVEVVGLSFPQALKNKAIVAKNIKFKICLFIVQN
jgi:hypothetical protein